MQHFFKESNGATLLNSTLLANPSKSLVASAISWKNSVDNKNYLRIKVQFFFMFWRIPFLSNKFLSVLKCNIHISIQVVNFVNNTVSLKISITGLEQNSIQALGSTKTVLTSGNVMDENSFKEPKKVIAEIHFMTDILGFPNSS